MTAADILSRWRGVEPVLGPKCAGWLTLLTIAEAGEFGITRDAMRHKLRMTSAASSRTIRSWVGAGLITWTEGAVPSNGGCPPGIARITPKGLKFLRLTA